MNKSSVTALTFLFLFLSFSVSTSARLEDGVIFDITDTFVYNKQIDYKVPYRELSVTEKLDIESINLNSKFSKELTERGEKYSNEYGNVQFLDNDRSQLTYADIGIGKDIISIGNAHNRPALVTLNTGLPNASFSVITYDGVTDDKRKVKERGTVLYDSITTDENGVLSYYTKGFSTQILDFPNLNVTRPTTSTLYLNSFFEDYDPVEVTVYRTGGGQIGPLSICKTDGFCADDFDEITAYNVTVRLERLSVGPNARLRLISSSTGGDDGFTVEVVAFDDTNPSNFESDSFSWEIYVDETNEYNVTRIGTMLNYTRYINQSLVYSMNEVFNGYKYIGAIWYNPLNLTDARTYLMNISGSSEGFNSSFDNGNFSIDLTDSGSDIILSLYGRVSAVHLLDVFAGNGTHDITQDIKFNVSGTAPLSQESGLTCSPIVNVSTQPIAITQTAGADTNWFFNKILINTTSLNLTKVTKGGASGITQYKLYNSSWVLLETASFVSNDATFNTVLIANQTYWLGINGANHYYTVSPPGVPKTYDPLIQWVGGLYGCTTPNATSCGAAAINNNHMDIVSLSFNKCNLTSAVVVPDVGIVLQIPNISMRWNEYALGIMDLYFENYTQIDVSFFSNYSNSPETLTLRLNETQDNLDTFYYNFTLYEQSGGIRLDIESFDVDFLTNVTVIASNTVSSVNQTFILNISGVLNTEPPVKISELGNRTIYFNQTTSIDFNAYFDYYDSISVTIDSTVTGEQSLNTDVGGSSDYYISPELNLTLYPGSGKVILYATSGQTAFNFSVLAIAFNDYGVATSSGYIKIIAQPTIPGPIINVTPTSVFSGLIDIFGGFFPSSTTLTTSEKYTYVLITMLLTVVLILLLIGSTAGSQYIGIGIYLSLLICVFEVFYFISIGYIPMFIVVMLTLISVGVAYVIYSKSGAGG